MVLPNPFRVAALVTSFTPRSHANVIVTKFLRGFPTDDGLIAPRTAVASLYIDQIHDRDIGRQLAYEFDIPVYESIRGALTLGGEPTTVDAVLVIAEHGDYPRSWLGQEMLPRRYFFEQVCGVISECGRAIPIYNDKHLSYRWDDAAWMYKTAASMKIPLWAASAVPLAWRRPVRSHPLGEPIDEAVVIGFHMLERYGFHALEAVQCQVERRSGGETGVRSVQCLSGTTVWDAALQGEWSLALAERAVQAIEGGPKHLNPEHYVDPHAFIIDYKDGLRATVIMLGENDQVNKFSYAARSGDSIEAIEYHTDSGPAHAVMGYLALNIERFFLSGQPPSPLERTYLTTGILEAAMRSLGGSGAVVATPHLAIRYQPLDGGICRPTAPRPSGASLDEWPEVEPGASPIAGSIPIRTLGTTRGPIKVGRH